MLGNIFFNFNGKKNDDDVLSVCANASAVPSTEEDFFPLNTRISFARRVAISHSSLWFNYKLPTLYVRGVVHSSFMGRVMMTSFIVQLVSRTKTRRQRKSCRKTRYSYYFVFLLFCCVPDDEAGVEDVIFYSVIIIICSSCVIEQIFAKLFFLCHFLLIWWATQLHSHVAEEAWTWLENNYNMPAC